MQKRAYILIFLVAISLFIKVYAQVPLFIEEPDSSIHIPDTLQKKLQVKKILNPTSIIVQKSHDKIDSLVSYAFSFYGNRYRRGGTSAKGFDCSGFTMVVFKQMGVKLPHTSAGQGLIGVHVNKQNIQKGDLILFRGANRRSSRIGHVGIVISEKGQPVRFIHSSTSAGVRVDGLEYAYYKSRYVKAVRVTDLYK